MIPLLFVLFNSSLEAQELGLKIGINLTNHNPDNKYRPGKSIGIFFDRKIHKRLEFSVGVNSTRFSISDYNILVFNDIYGSSQSYKPSRMVYSQSNFLELPIDMAFNIADNIDAKWSYFFTGGYSIGQLINKKEINFYSDNTETKSIYAWQKDFNKAISIYSVGIEVRHYNRKIKFATGIQVRYYPIYRGVRGPFGNYYTDTSESITMFNLYFKTGFSLKVKNNFLKN